MILQQATRRITLVETGGFLAVILVMWLDEILDLPHNLFGFQATPVNWVEGIIESVMVLGCAGLVIPLTHFLLKRVRQLQGLLPICSHCKRVRDDQGYWRQIEAYVHEHSEAEFSHGVCPDCCVTLYPDFFGPKPADFADPPAGGRAD